MTDHNIYGIYQDVFFNSSGKQKNEEKSTQPDSENSYTLDCNDCSYCGGHCGDCDCGGFCHCECACECDDDLNSENSAINDSVLSLLLK